MAHGEDPLADLAAVAEVRQAAQQARDVAARLAWHRGVRRHREQCRTEVALIAASGSARLLGARVPTDRLRMLAAGQLPADAAERVSLGVLRATTLAAFADGEHWAAPRGFLARLHTAAAAGLEPADRIGRPEDQGVGRLIAALELLDEPVRDQAVLCAVLEAELVESKAFGPMNDAVARAAVRSLAQVRGLDPAGLTLAEVGQADDPAGGAQALSAYRTGSRAGVCAWIVWWCERLSAAEAEANDACDRAIRTSRST